MEPTDPKEGQHGPAPAPGGDPDDTLSPREDPVPHPLPPPGPIFPVPGWDRFQFKRFLGQGGTGKVFLAYDPLLRRDVAVKLVRDDDPGLTRRIISRGRAQARVNHERVCKVYEVDQVRGWAYIAMQYVDGYPLYAIADELTVEQKVILLRDAAEGVYEAHRVGLIHRNIRPDNLMVERTEDGRLNLYVMGFGSGLWATARGTLLGSSAFHYMSPEQLRGERQDRRVDVYGLGATLYRILTGVHGGNRAMLHMAQGAGPRPLRALDPDIPADVEAIVLKCLQKDRSARYDSARALAEDLNRFLAGEPVMARSTGLAGRPRSD